MASRKRIPQIKLPELDETSSIVIGNTILFIHLAYDDSPSDPLKDCDGMGNIEQINSRQFHGISTTTALGNLYDDRDAVPLRYIDHGGQCQWIVEYDHQDIYESILTDIVRRRLEGRTGEDVDEPDWLDKINGIWTPDKSTSESYNEQDGLSRREWMVKQAASACETYTDYCNGSVYGYDVKQYAVLRDDDGEVLEESDDYDSEKPIHEDSCWGFYGWEYFKDEVLGVVKWILKEQKFSRRAIDAAIKEAA